MKKGKKFLKTVLVTMAFVLGLGTVALAEDGAVSSVTVKGVNIEAAVVQDGDVTMIPVRPITTALGFELTWTGGVSKIELTSDDLSVHFFVGENKIYKGDEVIAELSADTMFIDGTTYAPLDLVEALGYEGNITDGALVIDVKSGETEEEPAAIEYDKNIKIADVKVFEAHKSETISLKRGELFSIILAQPEGAATWSYKVDVATSFAARANGTGLIKEAAVLKGEPARVWTFEPFVQGTYIFTFELNDAAGSIKTPKIVKFSVVIE